MVRIIAIALHFFIVGNCLIRTGRATTDNNLPTITKGDYLFFQTVIQRIERGDIVVYSPPLPEPHAGKLYPSRIIGLPGETVTLNNRMINFKNTDYVIPTVAINGKSSELIPEKLYKRPNENGLEPLILTEKIGDLSILISKSAIVSPAPEYSGKLSDDEYFVMNDNRDFSRRKSAHHYGKIKKDSIAWKYLFTYIDAH